MKRKIMLLIVLLIIPHIAWGLTDTRSLTVTVPAIFTLSFLETPTPVINFGKVEPGTSSPPYDIPAGGLKILCKTNNGNVWYLKVSDTGDLVNISNPSATISNSNFMWYGTWTPGGGTLVKTVTPMSTAANTVYTSSAGEGNNMPAGTEIQMMFGLNIPNNVQAGNYQTTLVFSMTE